MTIREPKEIDAMSAHTAKVSQDLRAKLPLGTLPIFGNSIEKLANSIPYDNYDDFGQEIDGMRRIMEDDVDFDSVCGEDTVRLMSELTTFSLVLEEVDKMPDDTKKAMNAHYVTGLSLVQSRLPVQANVLIICAGNGNDVARLTYRGVPNFANLDIVGASPFRPLARFATKTLTGNVRVRPEYLEKIPLSFFLQSYDLILCHHGLHHVMRSEEGVLRLRTLLDRLTPNGLLVGDKMDLVGVDTMAQFSFMPSSGVEMCGMNRTKYMEGAMNVRVMDKIWEDPILSDRRLYDSFKDFNINLLQGRGAFQVGRNIFGDKFDPPRSVLTASKSSATRCITYVEIAKRSIGFIPHDIPPNPPARLQYELVQKKNHDSAVVDLMNFPVNKGLHLQVSDVPYVGINSLFSEKNDGITARVVIGEGSIYVTTIEAVPRYFVGPGKTRSGLPILRLQCEYMEGSQFPLILTDPIHLGVDCPSSFRARQNYYDAMVRASPWIAEYIHAKMWFTTLPPEAKEWEGIVIMGTATPSPMQGEKYTHSARYVKWRNTVDLAYSDGIWEVDVVTKERIRPRPDKIRPNAPSNVRHVQEALNADDLYNLLLIEYDPAVEERDLVIQAGLYHVEPLPGVLIALRYPNRPCRDATIMRTKLQLLENVGYDPPRTYSEYRGEQVEDVDSWLMDIGLVGGGGNSKGDGPSLDSLVLAVEIARGELVEETLYQKIQSVPYGGKVVGSFITYDQFSAGHHNAISPSDHNQIVSNTRDRALRCGAKWGVLGYTRFPFFQYPGSTIRVVVTFRCNDGNYKVWVADTNKL